MINTIYIVTGVYSIPHDPAVMWNVMAFEDEDSASQFKNKLTNQIRHLEECLLKFIDPWRYYAALLDSETDMDVFKREWEIFDKFRESLYGEFKRRAETALDDPFLVDKPHFVFPPFIVQVPSSSACTFSDIEYIIERVPFHASK